MWSTSHVQYCFNAVLRLRIPISSTTFTLLWYKYWSSERHFSKMFLKKQIVLQIKKNSLNWAGNLLSTVLQTSLIIRVSGENVFWAVGEIYIAVLWVATSTNWQVKRGMSLVCASDARLLITHQRESFQSTLTHHSFIDNCIFYHGLL